MCPMQFFFHCHLLICHNTTQQSGSSRTINQKRRTTLCCLACLNQLIVIHDRKDKEVLRSDFSLSKQGEVKIS